VSLFDNPTELPTWRDYVEAVGRVGRHWIFRGVLESWTPETSLERACRSWGLLLKDARKLERHMTRDFLRHPEGWVARRRASRTDIIETWALMQHHGAPTRLMDWTYSPYVAAYFAFDAWLQRHGLVSPAGSMVPRPAVWAMDTEWLDARLKERLDAISFGRDAPVRVFRSLHDRRII
jgi:FRG domain